MVFKPPKTWNNSGVKDTDLNREVRDQIRAMQKQILLLQSSTSSGTVSTGTIIPITGSAVPSGYLLCDGRSNILKSAYNDLWLRIGVAYGAATATTFTLPDFRNKFLRGNPAVGDGTITGRGSSSGSDSATLSFALTQTNTATANTSDSHYHSTNYTHSHDGTAIHGWLGSTVGHAHNNSSHGHGIGGSTANGNRGTGNVLRAFASHGHSTNTGDLGASSTYNDFVNVSYNETVSTVYGDSSTSTTSADGAHSHTVPHNMVLDHSHTVSTLPGYADMAFVIKT